MFVPATFNHGIERVGVTSEGAGGKQSIIRRPDQFRPMLRAFAFAAGIGRDIVSSEEIQAREIVSRDDALDLVERSPGIKGADLDFDIVRDEPYLMAISLAGLRSSRLPEICAGAVAKWN